MYPERYRLADVTASVLAALERRRPAFAAWSPEVEQELRAAATQTLSDIGRQFSEVAADAPYWTRLEGVVQQVALPRYLHEAKAQHAFERGGYGLWRGGDLVSRAAYAALGLVLALAVWRAAFVPKWLELLPLALVLFGPLIPDLQIGSARRRYGKSLDAIVAAMREEQQHLDVYQPLLKATESPDPPEPAAPRARKKERT